MQCFQNFVVSFYFRLFDLPDSVIAISLQFLPLVDHLRVYAVNKLLRAIATRPSSWHLIDLGVSTLYFTPDALQRLANARPRVLRVQTACSLADASLSALRLMLPTVEELVIDLECLRQLGEFHFPKLRRLTVLSWHLWQGDRSALFDALVDKLAQCEALESLHLYHQFPVSEFCKLPAWSKFLTLPVVCLRTHMPAHRPFALSSLISLPLTELDVEGAELRDCKDIAKLFPRLTSFDCGNGRVSEQLLPELVGLPLTRLRTSARPQQKVTGRSFPLILSFSLRALDLMDVLSTTDEQAKLLFSGLTQLESLSISYCCVEIDRNVQHLHTIAKLTALKWQCKPEFDISGTVQRMRSLRTLEMPERHSPDLCFAISRNLLRLRELSAVNVSNLSALDVVSALSTMPSLTFLYVYASDVSFLVNSLSSPGAFPALESLHVCQKRACAEAELQRLRNVCKARESPILTFRTDKLFQY